jgi:hypothetical protein
MRFNYILAAEILGVTAVCTSLAVYAATLNVPLSGTNLVIPEVYCTDNRVKLVFHKTQLVVEITGIACTNDKEPVDGNTVRPQYSAHGTKSAALGLQLPANGGSK